MFVVDRAAEIDEVKVNGLDFCTSKISTAEIYFADRFRIPVMLLFIFVGVETGSGAFAGQRTVDKSASRRPHMKRCIIQQPVGQALPDGVSRPHRPTFKLAEQESTEEAEKYPAPELCFLC